MLLSSITRIATVAAACFCLPFCRRENEEITSAFGTTNTHSRSNSESEPSSTDDTASIYEVFLSFCGDDTRKGFTDFLYTYLNSAGIQTFRDNNKLKVGGNISSELLKAIKTSKISIPIFSKNYASSKWCLLELAQMVECCKNGEHMIYPIFYDVDPSDVRNQKGCYEKAFRDHEKGNDEETVRNWRESMRMVGKLKGLELKKETDGSEGALVKIIVEKVLLQLRKNDMHVPENLVGINTHVERLEGLLEVGTIGVRIVGIYGMGGIGKTTISKVTYNKLFEHFESHCFLENIRENSEHCDGDVTLQKQLISKLQNMEAPKFLNINEGSKIIKDTVRGKKVLIVLDDVDKISQVSMLIGHPNWFSAQSRIIITTREKSILDQIEKNCRLESLFDVYRSYKAEYMDESDSLKLFCKHAFKRDIPAETYEDHSKEVVCIAAGLPLVLVVLGSLLFNLEGQDLWEASLEQLRVIQPEEILKKLRISFDTLRYEQKQIYLDIAIYFSGSDITIPSYMWDDCGFYPIVTIDVLVRKSLITIDADKRVSMHDQLIDLGRQIVREERELGMQSRFWNKEESRRALLTNQGTKFVTALQLINGYERSKPIPASHFSGVANIRFLNLWQQDLEGDFTRLLSNLRWFRWNFPGRLTSTNLHMEDLVILDLSRNSQYTDEEEDTWSRIKVGKKLKVLDLSGISSAPPHFSTFVSLEILKISGCWSMCRLDGIEQLKLLKHIKIVACGYLETLPNLSNLEKLVCLHLTRCRKLVEIQGLEKLGLLQTLKADKCSNLVNIDGLLKLINLEQLVLNGCCSLEGNLDVSELKKLKELDVGGCSKLTEIKGLHELKSLEDLTLAGCNSLEGDLDFSELIKLKSIYSRGCKKLTSVKGLQMLISLERLDFSGCSFKGVLDLSSLKKLRQLFAGGLEVANFTNSYKLNRRSLLDNDNVLDLQYLELEWLCLNGLNVCDGSTKKIMDLSCLKRIQVLKINDFLYIEKLSCLDRLECLTTLDIDHCNSLERLDLPTSGVLDHINVTYCNSLYEIKGIGGIASLTGFYIGYCPKLKEIEDLRKLESLRILTLERNKELIGICGLDNVKSLYHISIKDCESIETLPDFSRLESLTELYVIGCVKISKISGLEELQALVRVDVRGCEQLVHLPDLPNTTVLHGPIVYHDSDSDSYEG